MKRIKNKKNKLVYSERFKEEALEVYKSNYKNMKETAKDLKVAYSTFAEWVKLSGINKKLLDPNLSDLEKENIRLRLEIAEIREERDIIKKFIATLGDQ